MVRKKRELFKRYIASDQLMEQLPRIGQLMSAMRLPDSIVRSFGDIDPALLRELSIILQLVNQGEPAGKLFRQNERRKPKKSDNDRKNLSLAYEFFRACSPNIADDSNAIKQVKAAPQLDAPKSTASIRKITQAYRSFSLDYMEEKWRHISDYVFTITCTFDHQRLITQSGDSSQLLPVEKKAALAGRLDDWQQYKFDLEKVRLLRDFYNKRSGKAARWDRPLPAKK